MQEAVRSHPELRLLGEPTFLFAFTSDEFDIYHVNDEMKRRGWRFNGLQYPNALHMAVTRPQTTAGCDRAVRRRPRRGGRVRAGARGRAGRLGGVYGGVPGGLNVEAEEMIRTVMTQLLDAQQTVPAPS